jgi:hypothetical protein
VSPFAHLCEHLFRCKVHLGNHIIPMLVVRNLLFALICCSPISLLFGGLVVQGFVAGFVAVSLAAAAAALRPGEAGFLLIVARPLLVIALLPALWILLQILPLGILVHPVWKSAQSAIGRTVIGHITIDPALSLIALGQYLSLIAVVFLAAAIAVERQRAEWILFALTISATFISLMVITHQWFLKGSWLAERQQIAGNECASLGTIIAAAACIRAIERSETRRARAQSEPEGWRTTILCGVAFAICALAFVLGANRETLFATSYGLVTLACVVVIRRFSLRLLGTAMLAVPAIWVAIVLVSSRPLPHDVSLPLAFAAPYSPRLSALSERMLADAPIAGAGAGTFAALTPTYREIDDPPADSPAPTATGVIAIELGKPMLWLIVAGTIGLIIFLLRASLLRGRDSFYSAMTGSCLLTVLLMSFANPGLFGTTPALFAATALGLGLAQSKSRKVEAP